MELLDSLYYPLHISSTPISFYGCPCGITIPVYSVFSNDNYNFPPEALTESLRFYRPLPYPYTWFVHREEAAIVNILDLQTYQLTHQHPPPYSISYNQPQHQHQQEEDTTDDDVFILEDVNFDQIMNESFQQASEVVASSGLTKKQIYQNLRVTKYRHQEEEEESEICVVCQVEFEKNERIGVLQCEHRFHPNCIKDWLLRKNVCPLCKTQALNV